MRVWSMAACDLLQLLIGHFRGCLRDGLATLLGLSLLLLLVGLGHSICLLLKGAVRKTLLATVGTCS
jgi:hypothetical protein